MSSQSTPPANSAGQPESMDPEGFEQVVDQRLGQQHDQQEGSGSTLPPPEEQQDGPVNPGSANA